MDTDDFSEMAYDLIVQASLVSDTLKVELGAMSRNYNNENDWLAGVQELCREILADPEGYVDFWNLAEEEGVTAKMISELAEYLREKVDDILSAPVIKRGKEAV